jgi:hypothetical protein
LVDAARTAVACAEKNRQTKDDETRWSRGHDAER